ncbi:MAG: hypothetical protein C0418_04065 [Coriobacteriaceae bacterium]|nr:hypothetical protein [Coriobacteriaceae bacterium]
MANHGGQTLLQAVGERVVARYLDRSGMSAVEFVNPWPDPSVKSGVDLTYRFAGKTMKVKVKTDAYFGNDLRKIADRTLTYYRPEGESYAFEAISNAATREPGWIFNSEADELHYYLLALSQPEEEAAALMVEPDEVFFGELKIDRDELHIIPMRPLREWFEAHYEEYTPRPVIVGTHSAWFRIIPRDVVDGAIPGIRVVGSVFAGLAR